MLEGIALGLGTTLDSLLSGDDVDFSIQDRGSLHDHGAYDYSAVVNEAVLKLSLAQLKFVLGEYLYHGELKQQ